MAITLTEVRVRRLAVRGRLRESAGLLYLLPGLLIILGVILYPVVFAFVLSVQDVVISRPGSAFVGAANYQRLLASLAFWHSIGRGVVFTAGSLVPQVVLGLALASLLNYPRLRARTVFRGLIVLPWLVPTVTVAIIWRWMFHDLYGVINHLLFMLHISDRPIPWLADPALAMGALIIANVWRALPLMVVLFLAGLQSIPAELYEAALVDGASPWQRYFFVILPQLAPIIWIAAVLRTIWTFNFFDLPWIMTHGGPADATTTSPVYAYLITFSGYRLSQGAAVTVAMFAVLLVFAAVYFRLYPGGRDERAA
jgi:ABC-type sugar transport system permease subunit